MKAELLIKAVVLLHEENFSSPEECIEYAVKLFGPDTQVVVPDEATKKAPRKKKSTKEAPEPEGDYLLRARGIYSACSVKSLLSSAMRGTTIPWFKANWKDLDEEDRKHITQELKVKQGDKNNDV